jgi:hypothetical protein
LYNNVKSERKTDFIIQKRAKKAPNLNSDGNAVVSPIKIIKVTDKRNELLESLLPPPPPSIVVNSIDNLLSTKQLEPVQVHSVVSSGNHHTKQKSAVSSINVKTLMSTSPSSSLSTKVSQISSNKSDEIRFDSI